MNDGDPLAATFVDADLLKLMADHPYLCPFSQAHQSGCVVPFVWQEF